MVFYPSPIYHNPNGNIPYNLLTLQGKTCRFFRWMSGNVFFWGGGRLSNRYDHTCTARHSLDVQREKKKQPVPHSNAASNPDDHYLWCCALRLRRWLYLQASVSWVRRYLFLDLPRSSDAMMAWLWSERYSHREGIYINFQPIYHYNSIRTQIVWQMNGQPN